MCAYDDSTCRRRHTDRDQPLLRGTRRRAAASIQAGLDRLLDGLLFDNRTMSIVGVRRRAHSRLGRWDQVVWAVADARPRPRSLGAEAFGVVDGEGVVGRRASLALISCPWSRVAAPRAVRSASQSMVTVRCGGSPAVVGNSSVPRARSHNSISASAWRSGTVRVSDGPSVVGRRPASPRGPTGRRGGPATTTPHEPVSPGWGPHSAVGRRGRGSRPAAAR